MAGAEALQRVGRGSTVILERKESYPIPEIPVNILCLNTQVVDAWIEYLSRIVVWISDEMIRCS